MLTKKIPQPHLRANLQHYTLNYLHRKYNFRPKFNQLVLRIPFNHYNSRMLRSILKQLIYSSNLPDFSKPFIMRNTRLVYTKRQSVADYLCNTIQTQKRFTLETPPICTCSHIKQWTGYSNVINDTKMCPSHFAFSAHQLPSHLSILNTNSKNPKAYCIF